MVPLALALAAAPAAVVAGAARPALAGTVGAVFAAAAFVAVGWGWLSGGGRVELPWAPALDLRISLALDGLAALYALLATGIGFLVLVYARRYIPAHLEHEGLGEENSVRFYAFMLMFMGSMVGLAMSQDLILLFVFWDITAISSYYLIAFDRHREDSRASAFMALLVTGVTAVLLLLGSLMLYAAYGTFSIPQLAQSVTPGVLLFSAGLLMAVAGLAKSAQVPFQFWLPRAMAAPTPVSAYLHSAAMVAAGVLLLGRLYPILQQSQALLWVLVCVGFLSMLVGGILALTRDVLKQLLAYSTISQYGYVVFMYGLGGEYGAVGAAFYVIAHAMAKSALFLTAGAVTEATGEDRLSRLGGLSGGMPVLAIASGLAAAALAALPLTTGFFKDELLFAAAMEHGVGFALLALTGAVLTLAYTWRFWSGIFWGRGEAAAGPIPAALVWPVAVLGALGVAGGIFVSPLNSLAEAAGSASVGAAVSAEAAYHLDARPENLLALATFALGAVVVVSRPLWERGARAFSRAGELAGPERLYGVSLRGLNRLSDRLHTLEVRDTRGRVAAVLLPTGILVGLGLGATPAGAAYRFGEIQTTDIPVLLALGGAVVAALATCLTRRHVTIALVLSSSGFSLAVVFAFLGAPDVALVAVLIETIFTLMILGMLKLIPHQVLRSEAERPAKRARRRAVLGVISGAFVLAITWGALSQPSGGENVASTLLRLTPEAHAGDAVTAILADFRGLDTMGEVSVVALVLLGIFTLLYRGRLP